MQGLDWLSGYLRDEIDVFVHMEQCCASEFSAGGDQEIRRRGRSVKSPLGEQGLHSHRP